METTIFDIPGMYADHHVMKVRDLLADLEGIVEIYASSAWKQVRIQYDPDHIDPAAIESALGEAGYPVGEGETPILVSRDQIGRDPQWAQLDVRTTKTNPRDREMVQQFHRN